jgi:hypothetical protein
VRRINWPDVFGAGADQPVGVQLLDHVRGPSGDAADDEYGV